MKQRLLILAAATSVIFAACNGGNNEGSLTQEQADSLAKVKTDSVAAALKAQNDSTIAAQAAAEARIADSIRVADSLLAAGKKAGAASVPKKTTSTSKPSKPPVKEEPVKEEPKKSTQDSKFENRTNPSGNPTISEEKKKSQDDKFNRRGGN